MSHFKYVRSQLIPVTFVNDDNKAALTICHWLRFSLCKMNKFKKRFPTQRGKPKVLKHQLTVLAARLTLPQTPHAIYRKNKMISYKEENVFSLLSCYSLEVLFLPQNRSEIFDVPPKSPTKRKSLKQTFSLPNAKSWIMQHCSIDFSFSQTFSRETFHTKLTHT